LSDWIVNDCGQYIEIIHSKCGTSTQHHIPKREFLESILILSEDAYVLKGAIIVNLKEFPTPVKDALDRIHISSNLKEIAGTLSEKRARAERSNGRRSMYVVLLLLSFAAVFGSLSTRQAALSAGFFVVLLLEAFLWGPFTRKYAPYEIWNNERLYLSLWKAIEKLQSYVRSGGTDKGSFSEAYRLLDVSSYRFYSGSSWGMVYEAQEQMRRVLRNIMRRVRPYVNKEKQNIRQMEQLVIPTIERLLPLLINSDIYSIEAWNKATEVRWPELVKPGLLSLSTLRSLISRLWVRALAACAISIVAVIVGSWIQGMELLAYFKAVYWSFLELLGVLVGLVVAHASLARRSEK
jgi:hypothetical protein